MGPGVSGNSPNWIDSMTTLSIKKFSCIDLAVLDLANLTVMIGPQASGKSVIAKLCYFFFELSSSQVDEADNIKTDLDKFIADASKKFRLWFPETAWGNERFEIEFRSGNLQIAIRRKKNYRKPSREFVIEISEEFQKLFMESANLWSGTQKDKNPFSRDYEDWSRYWAIRNMTYRSLADMMGEEYIRSQMFIPAGRSFFYEY